MLRPHLHQARHGAFKFKRAVARWIKRVRLTIGRGHEFDLMFIKRVNERNKAHRLIALVGAQARNIVDKQSVEMLRQCEIIRRASGRHA